MRLLYLAPQEPARILYGEDVLADLTKRGHTMDELHGLWDDVALRGYFVTRDDVVGVNITTIEAVHDFIATTTP